VQKSKLSNWGPFDSLFQLVSQHGSNLAIWVLSQQQLIWVLAETVLTNNFFVQLPFLESPLPRLILSRNHTYQTHVHRELRKQNFTKAQYISWINK